MNVIGQVSKVQTPALLNVVKSAVETANTSIQNYLQEINNIENEAFAAFSEAQNTDKMLFDPDKQYEADVRRQDRPDIEYNGCNCAKCYADVLCR